MGFDRPFTLSSPIGKNIRLDLIGFGTLMVSFNHPKYCYLYRLNYQKFNFNSPKKNDFHFLSKRIGYVIVIALFCNLKNSGP